MSRIPYQRRAAIVDPATYITHNETAFGSDGQPSWWSETLKSWRKKARHEWDNFVAAARREAGREVEVDDSTAGATLFELMYLNAREGSERAMERAGQRFRESREGKAFVRGVTREEVAEFLTSPLGMIMAGLAIILIIRR